MHKILPIELKPMIEAFFAEHCVNIVRTFEDIRQQPIRTAVNPHNPKTFIVWINHPADWSNLFALLDGIKAAKSGKKLNNDWILAKQFAYNQSI